MHTSKVSNLKPIHSHTLRITVKCIIHWLFKMTVSEPPTGSLPIANAFICTAYCMSHVSVPWLWTCILKLRHSLKVIHLITYHVLGLVLPFTHMHTYNNTHTRVNRGTSHTTLCDTTASTRSHLIRVFALCSDNRGPLTVSLIYFWSNRGPRFWKPKQLDLSRSPYLPCFVTMWTPSTATPNALPFIGESVYNLVSNKGGHAMCHFGKWEGETWARRAGLLPLCIHGGDTHHLTAPPTSTLHRAASCPVSPSVEPPRNSCYPVVVTVVTKEI